MDALTTGASTPAGCSGKKRGCGPSKQRDDAEIEQGSETGVEELRARLKVKSDERHYFCQSTQLLQATRRFPEDQQGLDDANRAPRASQRRRLRGEDAEIVGALPGAEIAAAQPPPMAGFTALTSEPRPSR